MNSRRYVVPFLLAVAVLTLNKTTGMSSVTSYSVMIFQKAGFAGTLGNVGDFAIKFTNLVVTLVAASLVDKVGRTWLLKVGTSGMTIGLTAPAERWERWGHWRLWGQMVAAVSIPGLLALHETKRYDTKWCHEKTT